MPTTPAPARTASLVMVAMSVAMLSHLVIGGRPASVTILIIAGTAVGVLAAREVRADDALGWTMAMGYAGLTVIGLLAALTVGIPGIRHEGWSVPSIATVACGALALAVGVAERHGRSKRRVGPRSS